MKAGRPLDSPAPTDGTLGSPAPIDGTTRRVKAGRSRRVETCRLEHEADAAGKQPNRKPTMMILEKNKRKTMNTESPKTIVADHDNNATLGLPCW